MKRLLLTAVLLLGAQLGFAADSPNCIDLMYFYKAGPQYCPSFTGDDQNCANPTFAGQNAAKCTAIYNRCAADAAFRGYNPNNSNVCNALKSAQSTLTSTSPYTTSGTTSPPPPTSSPMPTSTSEPAQCIDLMYFKDKGATACPSYGTDNTNCASPLYASRYPGNCSNTAKRCGSDAAFKGYNPNNSSVCSNLAKATSTTTTTEFGSYPSTQEPLSTSSGPTPTTTTSSTSTMPSEPTQCIDLMFWRGAPPGTCNSYGSDPTNCADGSFASRYADKCPTVKNRCSSDPAFAEYSGNNKLVCGYLTGPTKTGF